MTASDMKTSRNNQIIYPIVKKSPQCYQSQLISRYNSKVVLLLYPSPPNYTVILSTEQPVIPYFKNKIEINFSYR